ncbi:MAG: cytochrome c oxidase subunit II [Armatimonadota bacterium]|nr:cytochrome c oxidase subunit II [Armatimonadota bacterium]
MDPYSLVPRASTAAGSVDAVFWALTAITVVFSAIIFFGIIYLSVKYRRGHRVDRSNPPLEHLGLELGWTIIPLIIAMSLFAWATSVYFTNMRPPKGTMDIYVVGKQWMWKVQHPQGRWEMNKLHVPVGRKIKLIMTSEDVIHDFFIPAFRLKQDVLPGQFTTLWFEPNRVGEYHLFCAEFCGAYHSNMTGRVYVMQPADYERWLGEGNTTPTLAAAGERLFREHGCGGCHGAASSVRAPNLEGIYGKPVGVQIPRRGVPLSEIQATTIIADDRYIHDSIMLPEQEVAAGYKPIMPSFGTGKNRLKEEEVVQLIDYIKSLSTTRPAEAGARGEYKTGYGSTYNTSDVGAGDIQARTGSVPPNYESTVRRATGGAGGGTVRPGNTGVNPMMNRTTNGSTNERMAP